MAQFMLILHGAPGNMEDVSPTEIQAIIAKYNAWRGKLAEAGKMVGGAKLTDEGGKAISKVGDRLAVVDGPYSETKEIVGGYFVIRAADYDEALKLSADCPHLEFGRIELRQIDFMGHPET
jgi:hypothetical protein